MVLKKHIAKIAALFCVTVMLATALFVPVGFSASAQKADLGTVTFDFSDACASATENAAEATENGVGFFGWGPKVSGEKLIIKKTENNTWATIGGYRLNKKNDNGGYDVYNLEPLSSYVVSFKVRVISAPSTGNAGVYIGYGAKYYSALTGNKGNYVNILSNKVQPVIKASASNAGKFNLYDDVNNYKTYDCSENWYNVNYLLETPEKWDGDTALAVWADMYTGLNCEIDDLSVTKLSDTIGAVVLKDDYSGKTDIVIGKVGESIALPDISDRVLEEAHSFIGWCKDEARTEQIGEAACAAGVTTVYSKWNAPVKITFKNTLDSSETYFSGMPGDTIVFPEDPVNPDNTSWFIGWYTNESYTEEFMSTEFGYSNVTVYSCFKGKIPGLKQDFEKYTVSDWTPKTDANGNVQKSNNLQFGVALSKQSEVTYNNSGNAIKLNWDSTMTREGDNATNPEAYDAATRYSKDNFFYLGGSLENHQTYVLTFKYKVEKAETPVVFQVASAMYANIWGGTKHYAGVSLSPKVEDEWQDGKVIFTADYLPNGASYYSSIFFKIVLEKNADTVIYFDDFSIDALVQPNESAVVFDGQNGKELVYSIGKKGEKIDVPDITHPDDAVFSGWYLDKACTEKAELDVFGKGVITVYAKWSSKPENFSKYPFSTTDRLSFGIRTMSIDKSTGVGYNDDYALHFKFRGNDVYSVKEDGTEVYMYERGTQPEHTARIVNNLKDGQLYKVTYKYKTENANNKFKISFNSSWGVNFWASYRTG